MCTKIDIKNNLVILDFLYLIILFMMYKFSYLPIYELTNCVVSKYKGHPQNASIATKEVNDYIKKHELEPISPVHQLMKIDMKTKKKEQKKNEVDLEVYIKVT